MAARMSFGAILRDARERRGYDLSTAARRLRIRPDILRAIEESDFSRMPPRGYARNMVNAYARFVGLNPTEITRMYLDEAYDYQQARTEPGRPSGFDMGSPRRAARETRRAGGQERRGSRQPVAARSQYGYGQERDRQGYGYEQGNVRSSRHPSPASPQFTNFYSGPKAPSGIKSKLPFIVAGIAVLVAVIVVLTMVLGNKQPAKEDAPMPISGLTDTSNPVDENAVAPEQKAPIPVAPDKVVFTYSVPSGSSAYIEVYESDASAPSVAETVAGPAEKSFDVTTTLKFVTSNPGNVELLLAGKAVSSDEMSDTGGGVYTYTVDFNAYLEKWKEENIPADDTADASGAAGGTASGA